MLRCGGLVYHGLKLTQVEDPAARSKWGAGCGNLRVLCILALFWWLPQQCYHLTTLARWYVLTSLLINSTISVYSLTWPMMCTASQLHKFVTLKTNMLGITKAIFCMIYVVCERHFVRCLNWTHDVVFFQVLLYEHERCRGSRGLILNKHAKVRTNLIRPRSFFLARGFHTQHYAWARRKLLYTSAPIIHPITKPVEYYAMRKILFIKLIWHLNWL